jgi:hypothetical protein
MGVLLRNGGREGIRTGDLLIANEEKSNLNRAILLIVAWFWLGKMRISLVLV